MMEGTLITMRNGKKTMPKFDVIHLEVSGRCQLNCPYCYSKSGTELAVGEWLALVKSLRLLRSSSHSEAVSLCSMMVLETSSR